MTEEQVVDWIVYGGMAALVLACVIGGAYSSRAEWKRMAQYHEKTLRGIAELDPAFAKVFGRRELDERYNWRQVIDGAKVQRLASISRRKNDRQEDTRALHEALAELKQERKAA